ncbi:hypothetical protein BDV12DRAFT_164614 [Aspergillus spectabilis]
MSCRLLICILRSLLYRLHLLRCKLNSGGVLQNFNLSDAPARMVLSNGDRIRASRNYYIKFSRIDSLLLRNRTMSLSEAAINLSQPHYHEARLYFPRNHRPTRTTRPTTSLDYTLPSLGFVNTSRFDDFSELAE